MKKWMKKQMIEWNQIILANLFFLLIIFAIGIAIGIVILFIKDLLPCGKEFETIIGVIILYIGLAVNLINIKATDDKFFKDLFKEFNSRFNTMNESLNAVRDGKDSHSIDGKLQTKEAIILDYLNLCSEEYLWYSKGRIDYKVWENWRKGMNYYLIDDHFIETVNKAKSERESYYCLFDELDEP